jgi:hypothetical protein
MPLATKEIQLIALSAFVNRIVMADFFKFLWPLDYVIKKSGPRLEVRGCFISARFI